jgi:hypothetical protein
MHDFDGEFKEIRLESKNSLDPSAYHFQSSTLFLFAFVNFFLQSLTMIVLEILCQNLFLVKPASGKSFQQKFILVGEY